MSFDQTIDPQEVLKLVSLEVDEKGKKKKIPVQIRSAEEFKAFKIPRM